MPRISATIRAVFAASGERSRKARRTRMDCAKTFRDSNLVRSRDLAARQVGLDHRRRSLRLHASQRGPRVERGRRSPTRRGGRSLDSAGRGGRSAHRRGGHGRRCGEPRRRGSTSGGEGPRSHRRRGELAASFGSALRRGSRHRGVGRVRPRVRLPNGPLAGDRDHEGARHARGERAVRGRRIARPDVRACEGARSLPVGRRREDPRNVALGATTARGLRGARPR